MRLALAIAMLLAACGFAIRAPKDQPTRNRKMHRIDVPPMPPATRRAIVLPVNPNRGRLQDFRYPPGFNCSNYWGYLECTTVLPPQWQAVEPGAGWDGALPLQVDQPVWPTNRMAFFRMRWVHK